MKFARLAANINAGKDDTIPPVKTLADQVQEFMRHEGVKNSTEMAKLIGGSVKRQNIDGLLAGRIAVPRTYLARLAAVMRTSTDDLMAGRYKWAPKGAPRKVGELPAHAAELLSLYLALDAHDQSAVFRLADALQRPAEPASAQAPAVKSPKKEPAHRR